MPKIEKTKFKKTILIWDELEASLEFLVLKGDYSRFNNIYINNSKGSQKLFDELEDFIYGPRGLKKHKMLTKFPIHEVDSETTVITCGIIP